MGSLDSVRLLHGIPGRRGPDRLARQPRLGAGGRLLSSFAIPRPIQSTRYRAPRVADKGRGRSRPSRQRRIRSQGYCKFGCRCLASTIDAPAEGSHFSGDSVEIAYSLRSPSGLPIDRLDVLADGEPVPETGFEKTNAPNAQGHLMALLPRKDTTVSLIAHSGDLTSAPVRVKLECYVLRPEPGGTGKAQTLRAAGRRHRLSKLRVRHFTVSWPRRRKSRAGARPPKGRAFCRRAGQDRRCANQG
jgi:hypothetical protein